MKDNFHTHESCSDQRSDVTEGVREDAEWTIQSSTDNQISPTQKLIADFNVARNVLESLKSDTGHTSRQVHTNADDNHQQIMTSEDVEPDTNAQHRGGKHAEEGITREPIPMQSE